MTLLSVSLSINSETRNWRRRSTKKRNFLDTRPHESLSYILRVDHLFRMTEEADGASDVNALDSSAPDSCFQSVAFFDSSDSSRSRSCLATYQNVQALSLVRSRYKLRFLLVTGTVNQKDSWGEIEESRVRKRQVSITMYYYCTCIAPLILPILHSSCLCPALKAQLLPHLQRARHTSLAFSFHRSTIFVHLLASP